jgi:hypothetical protein
VTGALLSHSCVPNTRVAFADQDSNFLMTVYASTEIERGDKITFCQPAALAKNLIRTGTRERRKRIEKRLVDCCCKR